MSGTAGLNHPSYLPALLRDTRNGSSLLAALYSYASQSIADPDVLVDQADADGMPLAASVSEEPTGRAGPRAFRADPGDGEAAGTIAR